VPLEIDPSPPDDVREALEQALERELAHETQPGSPWWAAGVRESVGDDDSS
jgi:hypothetical protein